MTASSAAAPKRDNLFGICAAIGEDFGFDPFWLRVALAVGVIANPPAVVIGYACAGLLVLLSRYLVRDRRPTTTARIHVIAAAHAPALEPEPLRRAA